MMADAMMLYSLDNANSGTNIYNSRAGAGGVYAQQRPPVNYYEQAMNMRYDMRKQREQYIEKQLQQNLPVCYLIIHSILLGGIGISILALQAYCVANNIASNVAYTGFWVGPIYMILAVMTLILIKMRTYRYYQILSVFYSLSMLVGFIGLIVSISLRASSSDGSSISPSAYTYAIAGLDGAGSVLIIIYTISMSCCLMRYNRGRRSNVVISYHRNQQQARAANTMPPSYGYPQTFGQQAPPPAYPAVTTNEQLSFGSSALPPPPQYTQNMGQTIYPTLG